MFLEAGHRDEIPNGKEG